MSSIVIPKGHYLNAEAEKDLAYTVQAVERFFSGIM